MKKDFVAVEGQILNKKTYRIEGTIPFFEEFSEKYTKECVITHIMPMMLV